MTTTIVSSPAPSAVSYPSSSSSSSSSSSTSPLDPFFFLNPNCYFSKAKSLIPKNGKFDVVNEQNQIIQYISLLSLGKNLIPVKTNVDRLNQTCSYFSQAIETAKIAGEINASVCDQLLSTIEKIKNGNPLVSLFQKNSDYFRTVLNGIEEESSNRTFLTFLDYHKEAQTVESFYETYSTKQSPVVIQKPDLSSVCIELKEHQITRDNLIPYISRMKSSGLPLYFEDKLLSESETSIICNMLFENPELKIAFKNKSEAELVKNFARNKYTINEIANITISSPLRLMAPKTEIYVYQLTFLKVIGVDLELLLADFKDKLKSN